MGLPVFSSRSGYLAAAIVLATVSMAGCKQRRLVSKLENATMVSGTEAGVTFKGCKNIVGIKKDMAELLSENGIAGKVKVEATADSVRYRLTRESTNTLDLEDEEEWNISPDRVSYRYSNGKETVTKLVSQKEILIGLLAPGRGINFDGAQCHANALIEHIQVRQRIALTANLAVFDFPQSIGSVWNKKFWTPKDKMIQRGKRPSEALEDMIYRREEYSLGCTTACKAMMVSGIYSYYLRGSAADDEAEDGLKGPRLLALQSLESDMDPLADVDPDDFDGKPTKTLMVTPGVAWNNWLPGDWGYIKNTDPWTQDPEGNIFESEDQRVVASDKYQGLEGSNIVYVGRGMFSAYYHGEPNRTLRQALLRTYGWRWSEGSFSETSLTEEGKEYTASVERELGPRPGDEEEDKVFETIRNSPETPGFACPKISKSERLNNPPTCGSLSSGRTSPRVLGDYTAAIEKQIREETQVASGTDTIVKPTGTDTIAKPTGTDSIAQPESPGSVANPTGATSAGGATGSSAPVSRPFMAPPASQVVVHVVDVPKTGLVDIQTMLRPLADISTPIQGVSPELVAPLVTGLEEVEKSQPTPPGHDYFYSFTMKVDKRLNWEMLEPSRRQFPLLKACAAQMQRSGHLSQCKAQVLLSDINQRSTANRYHRILLCKGTAHANQTTSREVLAAAQAPDSCVVGGAAGLISPSQKNSPLGKIYRSRATRSLELGN